MAVRDRALLLLIIVTYVSSQTYLPGGQAALQRFKDKIRLSLRHDPLTPDVKSLDIDPTEIRDCVLMPDSEQCYQTKVQRQQYCPYVMSTLAALPLYLIDQQLAALTHRSDFLTSDYEPVSTSRIYV